MIPAPSTIKSPSDKVQSIHKVMAVLNITFVVIMALLGIYQMLTDKIDSGSSILILAAFPLFVAIIHLFIAKSIKKGKKSARIFSFLIGFLILFYFPIGTFFGVLLMYLTTVGWERDQILSNA